MSKSHEEFGRLAFDFLKDCIIEGCFECNVEPLTDLAVKAGLIQKVKYDPEKHDSPDWECEPGDEIYWWGGDDDSDALAN